MCIRIFSFRAFDRRLAGLAAPISSGVRQGAESAPPPPAGRVRLNTPAGRGLRWPFVNWSSRSREISVQRAWPRPAGRPLILTFLRASRSARNHLFDGFWTGLNWKSTKFLFCIGRQIINPCPRHGKSQKGGKCWKDIPMPNFGSLLWKMRRAANKNHLGQPHICGRRFVYCKVFYDPRETH